MLANDLLLADVANDRLLRFEAETGVPLGEFVPSGSGGLVQPLDPTFGPDGNPMHHLGALTIYFCWIVLISGIWLLIFFRTSVSGAFESVEYLTREQWYLGGIMRSLHRYASDAGDATFDKIKEDITVGD